MTIELRDYQKEALEAILSEYSAGVTRQLISLPTGSGKTVLMAAIAKHFNKKTLLLAHREELIIQAEEKFKLFWPEANIGICMAERNDYDNEVVIGSVQSCSRPNRLDLLKEQGFEVLMIDEAHHSISDSYQSVIHELGFAENANKFLLGVTATPQRSDKQGLGILFEKVVFNRSISTMIRAGYLSPVVGRKILTNCKLEKIRMSNGDFSLDELSEAVNNPDRNAFIVKKFLEYAPGRKGVAFCVDVQHCKDLASAFKAAGIESTAVYGSMPSDDRKNALAGLKSGKIQVATSCNVLIEGFDEPSIDAIIMGRPTKSHGLYIQSVGRGLRLWPGKQNCLVMDFTDRGHNLDSVMTLANTIPEALQVEVEDGIEREEVDRTSKVEFIENVDREFDIVGASRFLWTAIGDDEWSLLDDERREIVMTPQDGGYAAFLYYPDGTKKQICSPLPLEYAFGVAEDYARRFLKIAFCDAKATWMNENAPPTQTQRDYLERCNAYRPWMSKREAMLEIRQLVSVKNKQRRQLANEPVTQKQLYILTRNGINPKNMNKLSAMQAIARLKQKQAC